MQACMEQETLSARLLESSRRAWKEAAGSKGRDACEAGLCSVYAEICELRLPGESGDGIFLLRKNLRRASALVFESGLQDEDDTLRACLSFLDQALDVHVGEYLSGTIPEAARVLGQQLDQSAIVYVSGFKSLAAGVRRLGAEWDALQKEQTHGSAAKGSKVCVSEMYDFLVFDKRIPRHRRIASESDFVLCVFVLPQRLCSRDCTRVCVFFPFTSIKTARLQAEPRLVQARGTIA